MTLSRRGFFGRTAVSAGAMLVPATPIVPVAPTDLGAAGATGAADAAGVAPGSEVTVVLKVNGKTTRLAVDPRVTLLDLLRERLRLTGIKKGCDRGQCGACTVHVDGRRVLACLTLAAAVHERTVTTIEGMSKGDRLHPLQRAFIDCDGLQCGFCTPGQVMSAAALLREGRPRTDEGIREAMSGNICRCGAYPNIVDAIKKVAP
ncbi:(2Fe-2S)-binding protein [Spirillospora sp. NPDC048911]|uniref:(2Fe-2S)-binding protein n=1 Tax=Spirillospora sp. NPDC048911 TaxID=3364527 RepID=UPI00371469F9